MTPVEVSKPPSIPEQANEPAENKRGEAQLGTTEVSVNHLQEYHLNFPFPMRPD